MAVYTCCVLTSILLTIVLLPVTVTGKVHKHGNHNLNITGSNIDAVFEHKTFDQRTDRLHGIDFTSDEPIQQQCSYVKKLNESETCAFVNQTENCQIDEGFINYVNVVYCIFPKNLIPLSTTILVVWWLFLFVALATCADDFFCPSLAVMSRTLHLSENIAGVTLVAFGNGAPDVFSAISAVRGAKDGDIGLALGALLGAGVFVTTVVVGAICMVGPFRAAGRPFLRDNIFYIATVFFTFYVLYDGKIALYEAILFLVIYVVYVIVVVVGRLIYQKIRNRGTGLQRLTENAVPPATNTDVVLEDDDDDDVPVFHSHVLHHAVFHDDDHYRVSSASRVQHTSDVLPDGTVLLPLDGPTKQEKFKELIKDCLQTLNPFSEWRELETRGKFFILFQSPILLLLRLTVPLVDEDKDGHGWCRLLCSAQCIITPLISIFLISPESALKMLGGVFPVYGIVILLGSVLAVIVFLTTVTQEPPVYNPVFAFVGFGVSVIWIQAIANEIINIMQALGIVFGITQAILGLTFLAWGNSIGDLISDTVMARQGKARTGVSACFGGPLFNLLLGVGIPFTIQTSMHGTIQIQQHLIQLVLVAGLFASLVSSLVVPTILKFNFNRYYGGYLFGLYVVFLTIAILVETNVIQGSIWG